jgi:hypothetical protein
MSITQFDFRPPLSLSRTVGERGDCIYIARSRPKVRNAIEKTVAPNYW